MEQWNRCPYVLKKRMCLTLLAGLSSVLVSFVVYMVSADSVLLAMGGVIFICCLFRCVSLWHIIRGETYAAVSGTCTSVTLSPLRRYRRICVIDLSGKEHTLLLSGQAAVQTGAQYRFYFQREHRPVLGNDYLDTVLSTNAFLGYEKLSEDNAEKE